MELYLNHNQPLVMHIDLNSCFATVEQQAYVHLRGKPIVVSAYTTPNGCVLSPSMEAKRYGVKTGMTNREARMLCPQVVIRSNDPPKVRDVHIKLKRIFKDYSPDVFPKSIDEAVIHFESMERVLKRELVDVAVEIKQRIRAEIGEWISCSIGIAPNRFLAKTAASLKKPDGLEVITHRNVEEVYGGLTLIDLCGINERYQARLNIHGIFTPLDFLHAPLPLLRERVFQSVVGYYWYRRLRGWEVDAVEFERKSFGQDYALGKTTADPQVLSQLIMKLCEKMGRRLRKAGMAANGIHVSCLYHDYTHWHMGRMVSRAMYATIELYRNAQLLFNRQPERKVVAKLGVSCYGVQPAGTPQLELFETAGEKVRKVSEAVDTLNNRYGEFVVTPAIMMGMENLILDRIAFGSVKELEDLYNM